MRTLQGDGLDLAGTGRTEELTNRATVLAAFEASTTAARAAIAAQSDAAPRRGLQRDG